MDQVNIIDQALDALKISKETKEKIKASFEKMLQNRIATVLIKHLSADEAKEISERFKGEFSTNVSGVSEWFGTHFAKKGEVFVRDLNTAIEKACRDFTQLLVLQLKSEEINKLKKLYS